jgi:hypothetical protein
MDAGLVLFLVMSIIRYLRYPLIERIVGEVLTVIATKWAIGYTRRHPSDKACLLYVDGMMLLYGLLLLIH